ncbi:thioredoxin domain-containing protein [Sphingomonas hengshuiensis]|uniref:Protein-disulfide isomerase n=1 Tax=Sphingomonas hengshuiensis TaxID=1609977 RepID=A0A7U4JAI6_9SPHN|nr:thioredoxin domain-containing protein [Sphingomonas hengshuiensis]AJP73271.1 protein-disulfide isomerase [Sphingomonas hengshuiensis]
MRFALALLPLLALAGCGGGEGNSSTPVTSATAVAPVAAPAGKNWVETVEKTADGYRQGNPNAPIKLVEYGSRNCPTCGRFAAEGVEPLREKYISTGKVSYEFRDFLVHGAPDFAAALLNQCVPTEAFFVVLDQFFANQAAFADRTEQLFKSRPDLIQQLQALPAPQAAAGFADALGYVDFMKQRGVPEAKARQCLSDQKTIAAIAKVNAEATTVHNVTGTPTFFLNDRVVADVASWQALEPALQAAGAR